MAKQINIQASLRIFVEDDTTEAQIDDLVQAAMSDTDPTLEYIRTELMEQLNAVENFSCIVLPEVLESNVWVSDEYEVING